MPVSCGASVTWTVTWTVENLQWHIVLQLLHQFNQTLLIQRVQGSGIHVSHLHLMGMLVVPLMTDILQNLQDSFSANFGSVNDWMIVPASMSTVTHSGPDPKPTLTLTAPLDWSKIKSLSYITHTHTRTQGCLPMWLLCDDAPVSCPQRDTIQTVSSSALLHMPCRSLSCILEKKG